MIECSCVCTYVCVCVCVQEKATDVENNKIKGGEDRKQAQCFCAFVVKRNCEMNNWKLNNGCNQLHCVKFGDEAGLVSGFFFYYIACLGLIMYREQKKLEGDAIAEKRLI